MGGRRLRSLEEQRGAAPSSAAAGRRADGGLRLAAVYSAAVIEARPAAEAYCCGMGPQIASCAWRRRSGQWAVRLACLRHVAAGPL